MLGDNLLLIEVLDNRHLSRLISNGGFLLNVDYPTNSVKLHKISCMYCNPDNSVSVKPSSKRQNKTGELWYSENRQEANSKAIEISKKRGYQYTTCSHCNPKEKKRLIILTALCKEQVVLSSSCLLWS